jgi:hypothetical protein
MTKQEKIQEEWLKLGINPSRATENGHIDFELLPDDFNLTECEAIYNGLTVTLVRPKSLHGIETNNGWIKIESEADLPKEKGDYWCIDRFVNVNPYATFFDPESFISLNERWMHRYTHYQPIIKPQPPIY